MLHPRKIVLIAGVLLFAFGSWWAWKASHPPLTAEEQIAANVDSIRRAVENRNARTVASYLSKDFEWSGSKRSDLQNQMAGAFLQWRDVTANVTGLNIQIEGDTAITTGRYSLALRPHPRGPGETHLGQFKMLWRKQDGYWVVTKIDSSESGP